MISDQKIKFIKEINNSDYEFFFCFAGGGSKFLKEWQSVPGASKTILGAINNNSTKYTDHLLGCKPEQYVSESTAILLADQCDRYASMFADNDKLSFGLCFTGSLATDNEREGRIHRFRFAAFSPKKCMTINFDLEQGRSREIEENIVSHMLYFLIQKMTNKGKDFLPLNNYDFKFEVNEYLASKKIGLNKDDLEFRDTLVLFPGSFNPLQEAHVQMWEILCNKYGEENVFFEHSTYNFDKPATNYAEQQRRHRLNIDYFPKYGENIIYNDKAFFFDKALIFRDRCSNMVFGVGNDTWERIKSSPGTIDDFNRLIPSAKFVVFDRNKKLNKSVECKKTCVTLKEAEEFHNAISSTQIRKKHY